MIIWFPKKVRAKNGLLDWRPGLGKVKKHALFVTSPRENPTPKSNNFF